MPTFAVDRDPQVGGRRHHRARDVVERAPILRPDVQAVGGDGAASCGIKHTFLNHWLRTTGALLTRLEHKGDITHQLFAVAA